MFWSCFEVVIWALSGRSNQEVVAIDISSKDNDKTFEDTMTYKGEGCIGFKAQLAD